MMHSEHLRQKEKKNLVQFPQKLLQYVLKEETHCSTLNSFFIVHIVPNQTFVRARGFPRWEIQYVSFCLQLTTLAPENRLY